MCHLILIHTPKLLNLDGLELICSQLKNKMDTFNFSQSIPTSTLETGINDSRKFSASTPPPNPNTCIIIGDSNTRHVSLKSNTLDSFRVPTFLIEDIDPNQCVGYKKIWIHVGTTTSKLSTVKVIKTSRNIMIHSCTN